MEQVVVLTLMSLCMAIAVTSGVRVMHTVSVHNASRELAELFAMARDRAMATADRTAIQLDDAHDRVVVHAGSDTLAKLELFLTHSVHLSTTRDSMAYLPSGLGFGAANLRVILSRGASHDTITVSRLGRVRR